MFKKYYNDILSNLTLTLLQRGNYNEWKTIMNEKAEGVCIITQNI